MTDDITNTMTRYDIIESFCRGKRGEQLCEDGLFANEHFAVVIDGSTSKARKDISPEMSNGRLAMETIREAFAAMPADVTLPKMCQRLNNAICRQYIKYGADIDELRREPSMRATASVIVYSVHAQKIWMIGDCQCMVDGRLYTNEKPGEAVLAAKRASVIKQLLADGQTIDELRRNDLGRAAIIDELRAAMVQQNITYTVIDGFTTYMAGIKTIDVADAHDIVLTSDGYPELLPTLQQSETALQRIITEDPLMITIHPATKGLTPTATTFDDRTYLRIRLIQQ